MTALKVLPNDLERLDQAITSLPAGDFANRKAWAAWAERRGKSFKPEDKPLIQRARSIQADAAASGDTGIKLDMEPTALRQISYASQAMT